MSDEAKRAAAALRAVDLAHLVGLGDALPELERAIDLALAALEAQADELAVLRGSHTADLLKRAHDAEAMASAETQRANAAEYAHEARRNTVLALARKAHSLATLVTATEDSIIGEQAKQVATFARDLLNGDTSEPVLRELHYEGGSFRANIAHWGASVVAESLAKTLRKSDGEFWNFIEFQACHEDVGPIVVTVQRRSGETPAQKLTGATERANLAERLCVTLWDAGEAFDPSQIPGDVDEQIAAMRAAVTGAAGTR